MKASLLSAKIFPSSRRGSWPLAASVLAMLAVLIGLRFTFDSARPSDAARSYVQVVSGWVNNDDRVSARFLKTPTAGNLLVAIASTRAAAPVQPPLDWQVAIDESIYSPGQAIFYKIASEGEERTVTVGYDINTKAGLQLYEYAGIDTANPLDVVVSAAGHGRVVHTGEVTNTSEQGLGLAAFVTDEVVHVVSDLKNDFTLRNLDRTKGGNSFSFGSADRLLPTQFAYSTAAMVSRNSAWRGQLVIFHRLGGDTLIPAATATEGWVDLGLEVTASNLTPQEREDVTMQFILTNRGTEAASDVIVKTELSSGLSLSLIIAEAGVYAPGNGQWEVGKIEANSTVRLTIVAKVAPETQRGYLRTEGKILVLEQPDLNGLNDSVELTLAVMPTPPALEQACPPISNTVFVIQDQNGEVDAPSVLLDATATNATYLLVNNEPNRLAARAVPLGQGVIYELDPALGDQTLYAWFGNYCQTTFVVTDSTRLVAPVPVESIEPPAVTDLDVATTDVDLDPAEDQAVPPPALSEVVAPPPPVAPPAPACVSDREFTQAVNPGDVGDIVQDLQVLLQCLGHYPQDIELSGIYGPITQQAVADFQTAQGLTPFGFVGPNTLKALNKYLQE